MPDLEINVDELDPKNIFTPGYGSPLAVLTKKVIIMSLEKSFFDEQLAITASSIFDIDNTDYKGPSPRHGQQWDFCRNPCGPTNCGVSLAPCPDNCQLTLCKTRV